MILVNLLKLNFNPLQIGCLKQLLIGLLTKYLNDMVALR